MEEQSKEKSLCKCSSRCKTTHYSGYSNQCAPEVEEGFAGFIFYRKSKKLERKDEASPAEEEDSLTQPEQLHTDSLQHTVVSIAPLYW